MATINDLHGELERLNQTMAGMLGIQEQRRMETARQTTEQNSFITTTVTNLVNSPLTALKEFSLLSLKLGYQQVEALDKLEMANASDGRNTRALLKTLQDENGAQIGGMLENLEMMTTALEQGIDLEGVTNKTLRNQLTELNKSGVQGQILLNFTKDLVGQGFSKEQVKETLQRLSDIGFYSIQSATSQQAMLKRMKEAMPLLNLQDPAFGTNLQNLLTDFVHDAPDTMKNAAIDMVRMMVLPEGQEQVMLREAMGGDRALAELRVLADQFEEARVAGDEVRKKSIQVDMETLVEQFAERGKLEAQRYIESTDAVTAALMRTDPFFSELFGMIDTFNLAMGAADASENLRLKRQQEQNRAEAARAAAARGMAQLDGDPRLDPNFTGTDPTNAFARWVNISQDNLGRAQERITETALEGIETTAETIRTALITPIELAAGGVVTLGDVTLEMIASTGKFIKGLSEASDSVGAFKDNLMDAVRDTVAPNLPPTTPAPPPQGQVQEGMAPR